jgi:hypothetical protein
MVQTELRKTVYIETNVYEYYRGNSIEFTQEEYKRFILKKMDKKKLVIDDNFKAILQILFLYFWQDERFETEGHGSLSKGICLSGNTGTGKTTLMKIFNEGPQGLFKIINTNTVSDKYQSYGTDSLWKNYMGYDDLRSAQYKFIFDDLGAERTSVQNMGNPLNPMERIILWKYEHEDPFVNTHFTTNLSGSQIEALYGTRVRSRLKEMVNFIELTGVDRRK